MTKKTKRSIKYILYFLAGVITSLIGFSLSIAELSIVGLVLFLHVRIVMLEDEVKDLKEKINDYSNNMEQQCKRGQEKKAN